MFLYSVLLSTGLAVSSPWWAARMLFRSKYREGLRERLGVVPGRLRMAVLGRKIVWVHAVSVGEVLAAGRLVQELEAALNGNGKDGTWRVAISTTTRTGQALARERFGTERVFWFPLDFRWAVCAWLRALQPRMLVLVESELWPRLLSECSRRRIPVVVVNARMSDRSFLRAKRVRRAWSPVLRRVALFLTQSKETGERLQKLGVPAERVIDAGNLKYDLQPRETGMRATLRPLLDRRVLVVAGSLLPPEETILLDGWRAVSRSVPEAVLLLAPRHPERFGSVAKQAAAQFPVYRASDLHAQRGEGKALPRLQPSSVVLLDTVGDLASVYGLADAAFVGGSLVSRGGGHNPLEPASFGVPILMGFSFENFRTIVTEMQEAHGIQIVYTGEELAFRLIHLLQNRVEADALGQRGLKVLQSRRGATQRSVDELLRLLRPEPAGGAEVQR